MPGKINRKMKKKRKKLIHKDFAEPGKPFYALYAVRFVVKRLILRARHTVVFQRNRGFVAHRAVRRLAENGIDPLFQPDHPASSLWSCPVRRDMRIEKENR